MIKYADDVTLCAPILKHDIESPILKSLSFLSQWLSDNKMSFRRDKCHQFFVSKNIRFDSLPFELDGISTRPHLKFLGAFLDDKLSWSVHVNFIVKRASSRMSILRQLKPFMSKIDIIQIYNACIRGLLDYCAPVFTQLSVSQSDAIERIQRRCHRIICDVSDSECRCTFFVPLSYRRSVLGFKLFLDLVNNENHPLHHLSPPRLKYSGKFCVPYCATALRSKSFIVHMLKLANSGFSV